MGIAGHATIADRTLSGAQAGIAGSVKKPGQTIQGSPAIDAKAFMRSSVVFKRLPEMYSELNDLKKQVEELKAQLQK